MKQQRILMIANNCLSQHNSNGRTLLNMLGKVEKDNVYQIYTSGEYTDRQFCKDFLRLTNRDVVRSYIGKKPVNITEKPVEEMMVNDNVGKAKNACTMLLRDLAWDYSVGIKNYVFHWVEEKKPDIVLLQLTDSTLLITLAMKIVKRFHLPLITYNTEDYYFKEYDFMKQTLNAGIIYKMFHKRFCHKVNQLMKLKPKCLYNCEGLKKIYDEQFQDEGVVIFCGTDMQSVQNGGEKEEGKILYAGNLGVGRHKALMEIGEALQEVDKNLCIEIYGHASDEVKEELSDAKGVEYKGFVSYEENCENIRNSRLLVHVDSFDEYYSLDTRFAFSTKIADYCASGIPIFLYSPEECESTQYMKKYEAAFLANSKERLMDTLMVALEDKKERNTRIRNACTAVYNNHRKEDNEQKFIDILLECGE